MTNKTREFETGATRQSDEGKLDYEGFLSPLVLEAFARYMNKNRIMPDGSTRSSDNWQKGMPLSAYMKSGLRHVMSWWKNHRNYQDEEQIVEALCGVIFNASGYLHEYLVASKACMAYPPVAKQALDSIRAMQKKADEMKEELLQEGNPLFIGLGADGDEKKSWTTERYIAKPELPSFYDVTGFEHVDASTYNTSSQVITPGSVTVMQPPMPERLLREFSLWHPPVEPPHGADDPT